MTVEHMTSSLFDDELLFPRAALTIDSALVMRDLPVHWVNDSAPSSIAGAA
jgi:hypothetical protein